MTHHPNAMNDYCQTHHRPEMRFFCVSIDDTSSDCVYVPVVDSCFLPTLPHCSNGPLTLNDLDHVYSDHRRKMLNLNYAYYGLSFSHCDFWTTQHWTDVDLAHLSNGPFPRADDSSTVDWHCGFWIACLHDDDSDYLLVLHDR